MKMGILYNTFDDKFDKSYKCQVKGPNKNKWVYKCIKKKEEYDEDEKNDLDV
jgi:hypothetical protein